MGGPSKASSTTGSTGIKYLYDAAGRLVYKRVNGVPQAVFLWQGDNLLAELDGTATVKRAEYSYYPGLDNLHAVLINGERLYAHADGLGNVIALTDEAQAVRRQYGYDDWGNSGGTSGTLALPDADRARWKGALWMGPELDLYYMRNRWYEPATGRFLSEDPKGLAGGINPAIFAGDNPVTYRDPKGLECEVIKFPLTDPKTGELTGEIGESLWCTDITPGDVQAIADYLGGETGQAALSFFTSSISGVALGGSSAQSCSGVTKGFKAQMQWLLRQQAASGVEESGWVFRGRNKGLVFVYDHDIRRHTRIFSTTGEMPRSLRRWDYFGTAHSHPEAGVQGLYGDRTESQADLNSAHKVVAAPDAIYIISPGKMGAGIAACSY